MVASLSWSPARCLLLLRQGVVTGAIPLSTEVASVAHSSPLPFHSQSMIDRFVPQMRGNSQQDSQEFLAFLMDGLHEDLNKVKKRQYITDVDNSKLNDGESAKLAWVNHIKQNNSIIVDYFQVCRNGIYRLVWHCYMICFRVSNNIVDMQHNIIFTKVITVPFWVTGFVMSICWKRTITGSVSYNYRSAVFFCTDVVIIWRLNWAGKP